MFGTSPFGAPHIKIVWNQSQFIRLGWQWKDSFGVEHCGYQERYQGDGTPCWMIMRWKPASFYGSPDTYYANTWMGERDVDSPHGFYVTGEYPYEGRYEIVVPLVKKEFLRGKNGIELKIDHFPLTHFLIDTLVPLILLSMELNEDERKAAKEAEAQAEHKRMVAMTEEVMTEHLPAFYGPVSFSHQGCRTSLIDRKMQLIQKKWDELSRRGREPRFQPGMAQGVAPQVWGYR
jgi:hypothetical protein